MSTTAPFQPMGLTYTVDNTAAVQVKTAGNGQASGYMIRNTDATNEAYIAFGVTAPTAPARPSVGTPSAVTLVTVGPTNSNTFTLPANLFFITASGTNVAVEITPGEGILR